MKKLKIFLLGLLLLILMGGILFYPKLKRINHVLHLFDEDKIVENFRTLGEVYPKSELKPSPHPTIYSQGTRIDLPATFLYEGKSYNIQKFIEDSRTTGLLVLQNDSIVFEKYYLENTPTTKNISWSMAKSFISALIGIAVEEGHIKNVMQPVDEYLPSLKGSGYEGVPIKHILQMSSGIKFNEDYADFYSDINRWGRAFAFGQSQNEFAASLKNERPSGTYNHYVSMDTHVLGMLLTKATSQSITEYMQEKLWNPLGMEHEAYWITDDSGMEVALGGLNATLRDFAKIGTLYLNNGYWRNQQIVPKEWIKASITPDAPHLMPGENELSGHVLGYGYQWWIPESKEGEYLAMGVYNQNIYINPTTRTVIVKLSANHQFNDKDYIPSRIDSILEFFRVIAHSFKG